MRTSAETPLILSVGEASQLIGKPQRTLYSWVQHKAIPSDCYFRSGRSILFVRVKLERWLGLNGEREGPELHEAQ